MATRISHWLELNFWQMAVRLLSFARPLSQDWPQSKALLPAAPVRNLPRGWQIAAAAWLLGFLGGLLLTLI